ncbi:hypothetical protein K0B04_02415 [Patescibacteria group bacterium]|nr:hypothetical protein [Patescibacteria group bacterium]
MTKKLTAKTQELNPKLPQFSSSFSKCLHIPPDTQDVLLKKGTVYVNFCIQSSSNFDTQLVIKVVEDVLHDSYYQSENISPVQSMEKAILEIKDKISQLSSDTLTADPQSTEINFISAVLWGNVIYIIRFGDMVSYVMKEGDVSTLEMISEGKFSSFSKLVDENEVFIFCTKSFSEAFPTETLLTSSIPENDLKPDQSCLLMRLMQDTSIPKEEEVDFGLGNAVSKSVNRERVDKISKSMGKIFSGLFVVLKNIGKIVKPIWEYIKEVIGKIVPKRKAVLFTRKITQISRSGNKKTKGLVFLILITTLLSVSVFFTFKSKIFKEDSEEEVVTEVPQEEVANEIIREDRSRDEEFKIKRISPEVFYDLKITDPDAEPTEIQIVGDRLAIVDRRTGKIYHSEISTPNFITERNTYPGIKSLAQTNNLLTFNDNEGYKTYDIGNSQIEDSHTVDSLNLTYPYSGYIYSISNDVLTRSSGNTGKLEGRIWGQNPDFVDARSMAIAYSVFVLKRNGELVEYSGGAKTNFSVGGLEKPLSEPVKVIADLDFTNIFVADRGNKSIVVLDSDGNLIQQYRNDDDSLWQDIRGIAVSSDEKTIFVLDSSKIYKIDLEE